MGCRLWVGIFLNYTKNHRHENVRFLLRFPLRSSSKWIRKLESVDLQNEKTETIFKAGVNCSPATRVSHSRLTEIILKQ